MKPLELLFALLGHFIQFPSGRLDELRAQAKAWEGEQRIATEDTKLKKALLFCDNWYMQVLLAVMSLPLIKSIGNWLMSKNDPELLDEEEVEEEHQFNTGRKFKLFQ